MEQEYENERGYYDWKPKVNIISNNGFDLRQEKFKKNRRGKSVAPNVLGYNQAKQNQRDENAVQELMSRIDQARNDFHNRPKCKAFDDKQESK